MKIQSMRVKLLDADGRTDMIKQIVAFRNFANVPNKIKERQQMTELRVVCAATHSIVARRVTAAQNRSFHINRIRPK